MEARVISEDLLDHDPGSEDHARRLFRTLDLLGVVDAARLFWVRLSGRELGCLYVGRCELLAGVEWLERAAETPPPNPEEGFAVLYDLADALDRLGETARALDLLVELDADSGGFRDERACIEWLAPAQVGSPGR